MYYIYALIDVRTNLPFYIGKGKRQSEEHKNKRFESRKKTVAERGIPSRSIESRKRLSENSKGDKNHFYGKTHSEEFSIQQSAQMQGNQFNSQEYIFTSACGTKYQVMGFAKFCREHNLTVSPLEKGMYTGHWPKSGKSAGWQVEKVITNIKE